MSNDKFITLEQLTRTTKGLVNKVNAESIVFDSKIGNLNNLTTTAKTDLVSAINEAATSGRSSGSGGTSDFVIAVTSENDVYSADKTYTEILAAYNSNPQPRIIVKKSGQIYQLGEYISNSFYFYAFRIQKVSTSPVQYLIGRYGIEINSNDEVFNHGHGFLTDLVHLPTTAGTEGQILKASSTGTSLVWANMPTIPTVTDTYSSSSTDAMSGVAVNSAITTAIGNINSFDVSVVQTLPTQDIDTHTIYFVPKTGSVTDVHDEYMYINNNWELLGSTAVDLSGYLQSSDIAAWAKAANKPTYTASEVGALPDTYKPTFYVNISGNNDDGFSTDKTFNEVLTAYQNGFSVYAIYAKNIYSLYNISQTEGYNNNNPYGFMFSRAATTGIYAIAWTYLNNSTTIRYTSKAIPTVTDTYSSSSSAAMSGIAVNSAISNIVIPTNVSSFTNDAGYLTLADLPIYDGTVQNG